MTTPNEPMSDERLAEIRRLTATVLGSTIHADFDEATAWFAILDLRREVDRLRAREAATREAIQMLSACEAVQHPTFTVGGIDGVLLFHPTRNVLWMREQARKLLGDDV